MRSFGFPVNGLRRYTDSVTRFFNAAISVLYLAEAALRPAVSARSSFRASLIISSLIAVAIFGTGIFSKIGADGMNL